MTGSDSTESKKSGGTAIALAVIALLTALVTNADRVTVLWFTWFGPKPPPPSDVWIHYTTQSPSAFEAYINLAAPAPSSIAAYSSWPDLHVWHKGPKTSVTYKFRSLPWKDEPTYSVNFFFNDGAIIPIGFGGSDAHYLQVVRAQN